MRSSHPAAWALVAAAASFASAQPVLITAPTTIGPADTTVAGVPLSTAQITVRGTTLTVNGRQTIASLALERSGSNPAVLTHSANQSFTYGPGDVVEGMHLIITGDLSIQSNAGGVASRIDVTGRGGGSDTGPGRGIASSNGSVGGTGGAYGGNGCSSSNFAGGSAYGSIAQPANLGSGGGNYVGNPAGAGGGCVRLDVAGTLTVGGSVLADGAQGAGSAGSGSGGSIWITAGTFTGSGALSSNGANGGGNSWGAGGGGRIAVYYASSSFAGSFSATGGFSASSAPIRAGAGTILTKLATDANPTLRVENAGGTTGANTPIGVNLNAASITIATAANVVCSVPQTIAGNVDISGVSRAELTSVNSVGGNLSLSGSGTTLAHAAGSALRLIISGDCTVGAGSLFNFTGLGFAGDTGPGRGTASTNGGFGGAGGAYGGNGCSSSNFAGGVAYGSITQPTDLGSGGGNFVGNPAARGGGALRLDVTGTLTVNGTITANGAQAAGSSGSGSGGSLWINTGVFAGAGSISASGGNGGGNSWGGGGGGRIAIYYNSSTYSGAIDATGGFGGSSTPPRAGAGTILTKRAADANPALRIENAGGTLGAITPIGVNLNPASVLIATSANVVYSVPQTVAGNVDITGGARVEYNGTNSFGGNLTLANSASTLAHTPATPLRLIIGGHCTVGAGSIMNLSGLGFPGDSGPGRGIASTNGGIGGTGGAYGGNGCSSSNFSGGIAYGLITQPTQLGSGGGNWIGNPAGAGGGALRLDVSGTLTVAGTIAANGAVGFSSAGSGSGGSIWINTDTLAGAGSITAHGSNGGGNTWGAGGGGRIAAYFNASSFSGTIAAAGGFSASSQPSRGGAGTVLTKLAAAPYPAIIIDNNTTTLGAPTPITSDLSCASLTVQNAANAECSVSQTVHGDVSVSGASRVELAGTNTIEGNLTLAGNSTINSPIGAPVTINVAGNTTIPTGSTINANGRGFPSDTGPGAGQASTNGGIGAAGGGYGGRGGDAGPFRGGLPYGSATQPLELGSGGGNYVGNPGGRGGGAIQLNVTQVLTVGGTLAANGAQPPSSAGAGSGGSLFIRAGQLAGSGLVQANGGTGGSGTWGPGGGGRIAIYACNITMPVGNITANRGPSGGNSQNGTIFFGSSGVSITEQPVGGALNSGAFFQMTVQATGSGSLSFQWRKRNAQGEFVPLVEGQNNIYYNVDSNTLFVQGVDCNGGGDYDCLVCDSCGCFPSAIATISVDPTGDYNNDGGIDGTDVDAFFFDWERGLPGADVNEDGGIDGSDVDFFFLHWELGC